MERKTLFKIEGIGKTFPGTIALQDISMEAFEGEIIGLVGENGAGKSTLLKIIMGLEQPSSGTMSMRGKKYAPRNPLEANHLGVGMVFQEQSLITNLTVGQNIFFGNERKFRKFGLMNWKLMYKEADRILKNIDLKNIKPDRKVSELTFATRQMVEIAKVLNAAQSSVQEKSLILLDEPTSVLNDEEIKQLFSQVKILRQAGNTIVFVSHRLEEVISISDRIYVFKDGRNVGLLNSDEVNEIKLYEMMVGRTSSGEYYKIEKQSTPNEKVVLEVRNLGLHGFFKNVSFQLHGGEVIGICGVVGSGKEDLCSVIAGDDQPTSGDFLVEGKKFKSSAPSEILKAGIISIPKERREEGIIGILNIFENISLSNLKAVKGKFLISKKKQTELCRYWIKELNVKCSGYNELACELSGGNAQKVVFARVLASNSKILILNHPTRGVDVGAKEEIYHLIREVTASGKAILLLGDTLDECIGLSNRILVMKDGFVVKEFDSPRGAKPDQVDIVKYMM